mgnify:CR=1 FL=1
MARIFISVLSNEDFLREKSNYAIQKSGYSLGYSGGSENDLVDFLNHHDLGDHFVLIKPHENLCNCFRETYLRTFCKVNVVIIGPALPEEHKPLVQNGELSGYLTAGDINSSIVRHFVFEIEKNGYLANDHIPQKYWNDKPKGIQQVKIPKFTEREKEILFHLCHGFTTNEISDILSTSTSNVRNHIERLKSKSQVQTSTEMVAIAVSNHWVKLSREKFKRHNPFIMYFIEK